MSFQRKPSDANAPVNDGANDKDKHGRKQNSGTNEKSLRGRGSRRDTGLDGADTPPRGPSRQP